MGDSGQAFRLLVSGDLHYDLRGKNVAMIRDLAAFVNRSRADAFAIVGDVVAGDRDLLRECLDLFGGFRGVKLIVPGNHDLWTRTGDSENIYRRQFPAAAARSGFHTLDGAPVRFGSVAVVGNIGWYDYSFRERKLRMKRSDYERKCIPGKVTFNDARFIRWRYTDEEFTALCRDQLGEDIRRVNAKADRIVALTHFLPFDELVPRTSDFRYLFARAYVGARCLGGVLRRFKSVSHVFCGHIHVRKEVDVGRIKAFSLSGGRGENMVYDLRLPGGRVRARTFHAR